jgi:hypothetical protein
MNPAFTKQTKSQKTTSKQTQTATTTAAAPTYDQIAARAFEIYLRNGCCAGQDEQNWLQAESELRQAKK